MRARVTLPLLALVLAACAATGQRVSSSPPSLRTPSSVPSESTASPATTAPLPTITTLPPAPTTPATLPPDSSYTNSDGVQVPSPVLSPNGPPPGATAECADGTYSFSLHRQGTCSYHGGVAAWLGPAATPATVPCPTGAVGVTIDRIASDDSVSAARGATTVQSWNFN